MTPAALLLPLLAAVAPLEHRPVECVAAERYTRISARATSSLAGAELQFRATPDSDWYAVRMSARGDTWSGMVPRAQARLARFEYRIAATDEKAAVLATPVYAVAVGACEAAAETVAEVGEPIVVRVPPGAPVVPPVPAGFSPAGVVAAERPAGPSPWKKVALIGGAAAAATVGVFASGTTESEPEPLVVPEFAISAATPASGSDLSPSRDTLTVIVEVRGEPRGPLSFTWVLGLRTPTQLGEPCLVMTSTATVGPERPATLALTAPLRRYGFCGNAYTTSTATLTIVVDGRVAREVVQPLEFRVGL